jgi:hypothetical protein
MDDTRDVADRGGGLGECMHRLAGGHIHGRSAYLKASVSQDLGRRIGIALMEVGEHDMFACADPAGDCLADLASSDDNDDVTHGRLLTGRL